jgi:predicted GNAT family N-acyltransferase
MRSICNLEENAPGQTVLSRPPITTEIRTPAEALEAQTNPDVHWLGELREMRGRVLYSEGGCNPIFLSANGSPYDADPFDLQAHHILLLASQRIVACARVSPFDCTKPGYVSSFLGQRRLEAILHDLGTTPEFSCEASRWIVAPDCRNLGLGPRVVAASWSLARSLGMHTAFVLAGTRYGQDRMLCRMGAQRVSGVASFPAGVIDDDLRLLYFNVAAPTMMIRKKMDHAMLMQLASTLPSCIATEAMTTESNRTWPL